MVLRVAVIGAGAAGLAAMRRMVGHPAIFEAVALEQAASVGGTWVYTERVGNDEQGLPIHSSMYANLRTNLPKEVMPYPGFPFPDHQSSFVVHQDVLDYLNAFTDHFDIRKHIRFNTCVQSVRPVTSESRVLWEVATSGCHQTEDTSVETYDAVFVCNGHFAIPLVPELPGQELFTGQIIHSHAYRHPEDYAGLRVVVLGAGPSGQDIALDLAPHAEKVYLCHRRPPLKSLLPSNVIQHAGVCVLNGDAIILEDGETLEHVNIILLCTGYKYTFPFLAPECGLRVEGERVMPTYKHIIHTRLPSLAFIGLCKVVCPFPLFDCQVRFALAALDGTMELPSQEEMEADTEKDYQWRLSTGMPHRHAHHMHELQWGYNDELAELARFEPLPHVVRLLYKHVDVLRKEVLQDYKKREYRVTGPETFIELPSAHNKKGEPTDGSS